ncbi:hypothetical protein [Catellatospora sichuanensis]|uniref:hypothetical protein n=1 Tax=Catellatospora sichuanensis TaxID=1969805 RepID=UPI001183A732|nr:hypothetical protein [Catellatospora sichuanensis]
MPALVRDLVPAFLDFWRQAADAPPARQLILWREYAARHPEVVGDVTRDGGEPDPGPALVRYPELIGRITANAPLAAGWIEQAARLVAPVLQAEDRTVRCVSMVGLAKSNGWVSKVDGRHTLFLAVEQVPHATAARILAAHEMAHAIQLPMPATPWPQDGPLGHGIFAEGFATLLTTELLPEYGPAEHLWFGPGHEDWLAECEQVLSAAQAEILACLDSTDPDTQRRYLTLNAGHHLPDRIGYLVGVRALEQLRRAYTWPELARWDTDRAMAELRRVLAG